MLLYKSRWLTTGEAWFDEVPDSDKADSICLMQSPVPVPGAVCVPFHTIVVDLSQEEEALLSSLTKDTRYEIRRAEGKDCIVCEFTNDLPDAIQVFRDFYNEFAAVKGLSPLNDERLRVMSAGNCLALSRAVGPNGQVLVWHAYYRGNDRVRLLHSASLFRQTDDSGFRNMVGRANRLLHWKDMTTFKHQGIKSYDLGGWYEGSTDEEKLRINQFKQEFGGKVVKEYNCHYDVTMRARVLHTMRQVIGRLRGK